MAYVTGLTRGKKEWTPRFVKAIDPELCIGCGRCIKICAHDVLAPAEVDEEESAKMFATVSRPDDLHRLRGLRPDLQEGSVLVRAAGGLSAEEPCLSAILSPAAPAANCTFARGCGDARATARGAAAGRGGARAEPPVLLRGRAPPLRADARRGGAGVQRPVPLLPPEVRLREREPAGGRVRAALARRGRPQGARGRGRGARAVGGRHRRPGRRARERRRRPTRRSRGSAAPRRTSRSASRRTASPCRSTWTGSRPSACAT